MAFGSIVHFWQRYSRDQFVARAGRLSHWMPPPPPSPLKVIVTNFASLKIVLLCLLPMLCYEAPQRAQVYIYI